VTPRRRKIVVASIAVAVLALLLFLLEWPLPHVISGDLNTESAATSERSISLPANAYTVVQWTVLDGGQVVFSVEDSFNPGTGPCPGMEATTGNCTFVADPAGAVYSLGATPISGGVQDQAVSYSVSFNAPLF
jgi:hypothetical protein